MKTYCLMLACLLICCMGAPQAFAGNYDKKVHQAQSGLKTMGYATGTADGIMGQNTKKAVKTFQKDRGLPVTGILDSETLNLILDVSASVAGTYSQGGNAGSVVDQALMTAQTLLSALGYSPGPADGVMGQNTKAAIKKFQKDKGLPATGKLNDATLQKMKKSSKAQGKNTQARGNSKQGSPSMDNSRNPSKGNRHSNQGPGNTQGPDNSNTPPRPRG